MLLLLIVFNTWCVSDCMVCRKLWSDDLAWDDSYIELLLLLLLMMFNSSAINTYLKFMGSEFILSPWS